MAGTSLKLNIKKQHNQTAYQAYSTDKW